MAAYGFPDSGHVAHRGGRASRDRPLLLLGAEGRARGGTARGARGSSTEAYVFRPCVVAGADAPTIITKIVETIKLGGRLGPLERVLGAIPGLNQSFPTPACRSSSSTTTTSPTPSWRERWARGRPGPTTSRLPGELTSGDLARELGWRSVPVPRAGVAATAEILNRVPRLPAEVSWVNAFRTPVIMDCSRARDELGWVPEHDALATLSETISGARAAGLI